ncbi:MAG TPA: DUF5103 domain-containing protein [Chitinophagales bacterium]|nr:DUF5103 domain-containing protein [Chitinophagales bacterium]
MQFRFLILFILLFFVQTSVFGQKMYNQIFNDQIKTVRLYPSTNEIAMPVLNLNSDEQLVFRFDELVEDSKTYYYTIVHCDQNWEPSEQESNEYIDGFTRVTIDDYNYSYNTIHPYVNYHLNIPNLDMRITQSGNYALVVYEDDPKEPAIIRRFMVKENIVAIQKNVVLPRTKSNYQAYQEITFNIINTSFTINNPLMEIHASVLQNQRWDNAYENVQPRFVRNNQLDFDYNGRIVFEAGNEFRRFDIRSLRFLGMGVRALQNDDTYLLLDPLKSREKYFIETDYNGQYYIDVLEYRNRNVEADYTNVHFNLPLSAPYTDGKLYVGGMFNNYDATPQNQMKWNPNTSMYENSIFMKQGFYDYQYYFMNENNTQKTVLLTEGSNYDAENQYDIFIYYRAFGERYDRIIGHLSFNSRDN